MGKVEGKNTNWHGHVTALTVAPEFRRLGLARKLMDRLEVVSDKMYEEEAECQSIILIIAYALLPSYRGYFVDLFVRKSNKIATQLYEKLGYVVYRTVLNYYSGENEEDAYGTGLYSEHVALHTHC